MIKRGPRQPYHYWTSADDQTLREFWIDPSTTAEDIAVAMGLRPNQVTCRAKALALVKPSKPVGYSIIYQDEELTPEFARRALRYEPETGELFWRMRNEVVPAWNFKWAGKPAGYVDPKGYRIVNINKRLHRAHRVIWLMQTGSWPLNEIDHVNGDRADNRWINLRAATSQENALNKKMPVNNTSGFKGVVWHRKAKKWAAGIGKGRKSIHLGLFESAEEAYAAYCRASDVLFGAFARKEA